MRVRLFLLSFFDDQLTVTTDGLVILGLRCPVLLYGNWHISSDNHDHPQIGYKQATSYQPADKKATK